VFYDDALYIYISLTWLTSDKKRQFVTTHFWIWCNNFTCRTVYCAAAVRDRDLWLMVSHHVGRPTYVTWYRRCINNATRLLIALCMLGLLSSVHSSCSSSHAAGQRADEATRTRGSAADAACIVHILRIFVAIVLLSSSKNIRYTADGSRVGS